MAQACHGALEAGKLFPEDRGNIDSIIVLGVKNKAQLEKAIAKLQDQGIEHAQFFEPDWDYGLTSIGTRPLKEQERHIMKGYRLWNP